MDSESKLRRGVDRISELPDAVICHILSFLPTIYAVWTTILSKRWNNLWKSVPNLEFDDEFDFPTKGTDRFMKFVGCVLSAHGSSDIQKLYLHIHHCENFSIGDFNRVGRWIRAAVKKNIVEMDLQLWFEYGKNYEFKIPQSLFLCKSLKVLRLYSNCIIYPTPKRGCFPSLKVLDIYDPRPDDSMQKLFSHFPVLEDLAIRAEPAIDDVFKINISVPELKTLKIFLYYYSYNYRRPNNFFINAPKLENLEVSDGILTNYILESTKCLVRAVIMYCDRCPSDVSPESDDSLFGDEDDVYQENVFKDEAPEFSNRAAALLARISNVKCLSLDSCPKSMKAFCVPALENLSKLELGLLNCYNWELLTELLNRSPKLEYLGFEPQTPYDVDYQGIPKCKWNPPEYVPVCLLSSLKTIFIEGFKETQDEMEVAKYLLRNGKVLNSMTISTEDLIAENLEYDGQEELRKEFSDFEKGSKICQVIII